ncbi:hypothetical protein CXF43_08655 [Corynebacterium bovis]|nr:type II toxin-antitoxin system HicA family toxin [Corynebacterium bovis]RRO98208.1 hypothetical protein CXF32_01800 [Corynebacterium bovis]RRQ00707.1 hypothetical protein CXF31_00285 [Corynebacterium bovis]RRQ06488.1 hypothetical protein CXF43_08655 [Corynebacterium bovis]RRQ09527.1 hypothetical protein CXF44_07785 [Corynebacterium bovis]
MASSLGLPADQNKSRWSLRAGLLRQRGSHQRWRATVDGVTALTTVPMHRGDIPIGTLRQIERQMEPVFGKGWLR